ARQPIFLRRGGRLCLAPPGAPPGPRRYAHFGDVRRMVARSAYAQLQYSPALLVGTVVGMTLAYLAPPLITIFGTGSARALGLCAWALMAVLFQPTLHLYRMSQLW